jgi:hypothetical protein
MQSERLHDVSKLSFCVSFDLEVNKVNKLLLYEQFNQFYCNNYINYKGLYKVLRRQLKSKRKLLTEALKEVHNEELNNVQSSSEVHSLVSQNEKGVTYIRGT